MKRCYRQIAATLLLAGLGSVAVCKGGVGVGRTFIMPAWGDLLSDQDIKDLIAQIRSFSGT